MQPESRVRATFIRVSRCSSFKDINFVFLTSPANVNSKTKKKSYPAKMRFRQRSSGNPVLVHVYHARKKLSEYFIQLFPQLSISLSPLFFSRSLESFSSFFSSMTNFAIIFPIAKSCPCNFSRVKLPVPIFRPTSVINDFPKKPYFTHVLEIKIYTRL
jgi:hypothetical protein